MKMSAPAPAPCYGHLVRHTTREGMVVPLLHRGDGFRRGPSSQASFCSAIYRYALKVSGSSDVIKYRFSTSPTRHTKVCQGCQISFYSKFCAATVLSSTRSKMTHYHRAVHETNLVAIPLTQIRNVLYDAMRRTRKWAIVLVVMPMNVPVRRGEP